MSARDGVPGGTGAGTEKRPFGAVVASAVEGFRSLARKHVELAKLEAIEAASIRGQGVGMIVASAHPELGPGAGRADAGDPEGGCPMGEATDHEVTEIEESRNQLEVDLRELEARVPAPFRSAKSVAGLILGSTAFTASVLRRLGSKRSDGRPSAEIVVRIVRDDSGSLRSHARLRRVAGCVLREREHRGVGCSRAPVRRSPHGKPA